MTPSLVTSSAGVRLPSVALPATDGTRIDLAALEGRRVDPWTGRPGHANPPDWDSTPKFHAAVLALSDRASKKM
jgi:hypothetical protein